MKKRVARQPEDDPGEGQGDAELVRQTLSGDTTAYDRLVDRYQRRAVAVSYRLLGHINDAMDVCQEAFLRAYRSLASLEEGERFGAWLMRIVSNLSLNYRRGRRTHLSLSTDEGEKAPGDLGLDASRGPRAGGEVRLQTTETEAAVTRALDALPEQQRLALILFALEGIPQKEVAEILECTVEMVKWNVFQARKTLKTKLAEFL